MTLSKIASSLEWNLIETELIHKSRRLRYHRDIKRLIDNIGNEVAKLSKAEVLSRAGRPQLAEAILIKVNSDIETVEGFLLVAALLG